MEPEFWLKRWQDNEIGFHQPDGQPLLRSHWPALALNADSRVCVPLCGKTPDLAWLAARGHAVTGIELSEQAAHDFFAENGQACQVDTLAGLRRYRGGRIEILVGDLFDLPGSFFAGFEACYDRAALIALPAEQRQRYAAHVYGHLPAGAQALLICLSYQPGSMEGPPFSVDSHEVRRVLPEHTDIQTLEYQPLPADAPLAERGARDLVNTVYRLDFQAP